MRPSASSRLCTSARKRLFTAPVRALDASKSKRSSTLLATLFTFWPPGPDARTAPHSSSRAGMTTPGLTTRSISTVRLALLGFEAVQERFGAFLARPAPNAGDEQRLVRRPEQAHLFGAVRALHRVV